MPAWVAAAALAIAAAARGEWASERDIAGAWCDTHHGEAEHVTADRTRVDCLAPSDALVAWEFDWARKWAEALGQALHYAEVTGAEPGIVLIYRDADDERYALRLLRAIEHHGLHVRVMVRKLSGEYVRVGLSEAP